MRLSNSRRAGPASTARCGRPMEARSCAWRRQSILGHYMPEWLDYAIAEEIHQLAGDTAQGNALGVLNRTARWFLELTGTLLSSYADDLFNTLLRTDAKRMTTDGYEWGSGGRERFTHDYGVIENH